MNIVIRRRPSRVACSRVADEPSPTEPTSRRAGRRPTSSAPSAHDDRRANLPIVRVLGHLVIEPMPTGIDLRLRVRELLALVVSHRRIARDAAAYALWRDKDLTAARQNLRVTLSHLMRVVEATGGDWLVSAGGVLSVDTSRVRIDVDEFEASEAFARRAERSGRPAVAAVHYGRALRWYRGAYLTGLDVDGAQYERLRLEALAFDAAISGARAARAIGEPDRAVGFACTALGIDPLGDAAAVELAAAVRAMGRSDAARSALGRHADELRRAGICPSAFIDAHVSQLRIA